MSSAWLADKGLDHLPKQRAHASKYRTCGRSQSCLALLAASLVMYIFASFAGTHRHMVPFTAPVVGSALHTRTVHVPALIHGRRDTHEAKMMESLNIVADTSATVATIIAPLKQQQNFGAGARQNGGQQERSRLDDYQQQHADHVVAGPHTHNTTSSPLPWRALHHIGTDFMRGTANTPDSQAPAYLVSAFLDTRPTMHGQQANIAVVMAIDKRIQSPRWKCLLQLESPHVPPQVSDLDITYSVRNVERSFKYQASTGYCELPQALQDILKPNNGLQESKTLQGLSLTLFQVTEESGSFDAALLHMQHIWVPVVVIPPLTLQEQQRYLSGEGSIAVCTPPVHTDGYAATLVGWHAFHKQMGVQQVIMYSFNPGPLFKPLMDFYARQGFAQVHEWIIPSSILEHKQHACLLPFFHASESRTTYKSPPCVYHQNNYAIPYWGQALAIQDCVYRAMAAKHRWVAILDLDEYIIPKTSLDWHTMLHQLVNNSNEGQAAAEYSFAGVKLCSGCLLQQQDQPLQQQNSTMPAACGMTPKIGFHHITWPSTALGARSRDFTKVIVDPLAVGQASVHFTAQQSPHRLSSGTVLVPQRVAVKLHDRVHDIEQGNKTFAARMLPLLKANIHQVAAATVAGRFDQQTLPVWPYLGSACDVCGSVSMKGAPSATLHQDLTLCSMFGSRLHRQIRMDVANMVAAGLFDGPSAWGSSDPLIANLYGGHSFKAWASPSTAMQNM